MDGACRRRDLDSEFTVGDLQRNPLAGAWSSVSMDLARLDRLDAYSRNLRSEPGQERLPVVLFGSQPPTGNHGR